MKVFILSLLLLQSVQASDFLPSQFLIDYTESHKSVSKAGDLKYQGRFSFSYPNKFRLDVSEPDLMIVVSNGVKSWRYTPAFIETEEGQVEVSKASELAVAEFLKTLKKGVKNNPSFKAVTKGPVMILTMTEPWKKKLGIKEVFLKFKDPKRAQTLADVSELEIFYTNNNQMKWIFREFNSNPGFAKNHFDFQIPPKTKVIEN